MILMMLQLLHISLTYILWLVYGCNVHLRLKYTRLNYLFRLIFTHLFIYESADVIKYATLVLDIDVPYWWL